MPAPNENPVVVEHEASKEQVVNPVKLMVAVEGMIATKGRTAPLGGIPISKLSPVPVLG